jgi:DNA polymerase III subunit epsilon
MVLAQARIKNYYTKAFLARRNLPAIARKNLAALDHLRGEADVRDLDYVVFDLETSGISTNHDRVLSVGAIRLSGGMVSLDSCFHKYVNPGQDVSNETVTLHGIKPDMVAAASSLDSVFCDFLSYLGTSILVAHQAAFDLHFLNSYMKRRYGFLSQNLVIDTLTLCRALFPPRPFGYDEKLAARPYSLDSLVQHFDLKLGVRHTALGDSLITALILQRLLARMVKVGKGNLKHLVRMAGFKPQ